MTKKETGGIVLSPYCSIHCLFCGSKDRVADEELRKQEVKVYKNLKDLKSKGIESIEISGADPLEYNKLPELISYIKEEGFNHVRLSTNGVRFSDSKFLDKIINSGLDGVRVPIYGSTPKIHDAVTQTKGSFKDVVEGLNNLIEKAPDIEVQISSLMMKQNKDDLCNIVDFVTKDLGVTNFYFSVPCIAQDNYDEFYVPFKELVPYAREVYEYALEVNDNIQFLEIPFCVLGEYNKDNIDNLTGPPHLGKYNQPPKQHQSEIEDLPKYRIKKKVEICQDCDAFRYCDGFFQNDINKFGIGNINNINEDKKS